MGRYDDRRPVSVTPFQGSTLRYGFMTNIDAAQSTQLGHQAVTGTVQGIVFGANSPKPARASRRFATGVVSSFINAGTIATARGQGWRVGKGRLRRGGSTLKASRVYVTFQTIRYAWELPNDVAAKIGNLGQLGIQSSTAADTNLVFGAQRPKPPRATRVVGEDRVSTFFDPSRTLPAGWSVVAQGIDTSQPQT
jgi:hypothetical protein